MALRFAQTLPCDADVFHERALFNPFLREVSSKQHLRSSPLEGPFPHYDTQWSPVRQRWSTVRWSRFLSRGSSGISQLDASFSTYLTAREGKRKCGARSTVRCCPHASVMSLDNRAANMQPDSHSIGLRCIKSVEKVVGGLRSEADSNVFHAQAHPTILFSFGFDKQLSWPIVNGAHRF